MSKLSQPQVNTVVAVNQAITTYQRMRAVADARRQAALDVAAELRTIANEIHSLLCPPPERLLKLAERLEA